MFFYPKADTPGCTTQACGLRDVADQIGDTVILGISPDAPGQAGEVRPEVLPRLPAPVRRGPRRGRCLRRVGREEALRQDVHGHRPLGVPDRRARARSSRPGTRSAPRTPPRSCWPPWPTERAGRPCRSLGRSRSSVSPGCRRRGGGAPRTPCRRTRAPACVRPRWRRWPVRSAPASATSGIRRRFRSRSRWCRRVMGPRYRDGARVSVRPGWRNGRRGGLKIRCPKGRVGSSPTPGTSGVPQAHRPSTGRAAASTPARASAPSAP